MLNELLVSHSDHEIVFAAAQDLDVSMSIQPTFEPAGFSVHQQFDGMDWADWCLDLFVAQGAGHTFRQALSLGDF